MFEKFSDGGRLLMVASRHEAKRLGSPFIGSTHTLLALLSDRAFGAVRILGHLGVDVARLRLEVEQVAPRGQEEGDGQIPFSPDAKALIESAAAMATKLGHEKITSSHFLLADLGDPQGLLPRIINGLGMDLADLRHKVWESLAKPDSE